MTSLQATLHPFVGHRPYTEQDRNLFFGRNRQVDDLLSLIQNHKCITLIGPAGSGKTSLVQAGLVSALRNGHNGVAGREWVICTTRPGVAPLKNLAHALSTNGILNPSTRATPDAYLQLENQLRNSNTGILDAYRNSEIAYKKNILLIIDQLEDAFLHPQQDPEKEEERSELGLFFNNITRAARAEDAAVYILLCMRSEFFGELAPFRRLQELINEGQYLIPRLRPIDVKEIVTAPLHAVGAQVHPQALEQIQKSFGSDVRKLPHLQFLLFNAWQIAAARQETPKQLRREDLVQAGGLEHCFGTDLQYYYTHLSSSDQYILERFFRALARTEPNTGHHQAIAFHTLCQITNTDKLQATTLLRPFFSAPRNYIECIKPELNPVDTLHHAVLDTTTLLYIPSDTILFDWQLLRDWLLIEKDSKDTFLRLVADAARFESRKTGYLRPPELDLALQWRDHQNPTREWALQYVPPLDFEKALAYLEASAQAYQQEIQTKEHARKKELKNLRKAIAFLLITGAIVTTVIMSLWLSAKQQHQEALRSKQIEQEAKEAQRQTNENLRATLDSLEKTKREIEGKNQELITSAERIQQSQKQLSLQNSKILKQRQDIEKQNQNLSVANSNLEREKREVQNAQNEERNAKQRATDREQLANIEKAFYVIEKEFNAQEENTEPTARELIRLYADYKVLSSRVHGKVVPNDALQKAMNLALTMLEKQNTYSETSMNLLPNQKSSLRAVAVSPKGVWAAGGDDATLYYATSGKTRAVYLGDRIRSIHFLSENEVLVGGFGGKLWRVDIPEQTKTLLYAYAGAEGNTLLEILPGFKAGEVMVVGLNDLIRIEVKSKKVQKIALPSKATAACTLPQDNSLVIGTVGGIFQYTRQEQLVKWFNTAGAEAKAYIPSAITASRVHLAIGSKSGKIWIYALSKLLNDPAQAYSKPIYDFNEHQSGITHLHYDETTGKLFSASLDNKVKIFNTQLKEDFTKYVITINDQKRWVWNLLPYTDRDGTSYLLTADEGGNLLKWFTDPDQQIQAIKEKLAKR